jgi:hypothetical protein
MFFLMEVFHTVLNVTKLFSADVLIRQFVISLIVPPVSYVV